MVLSEGRTCRPRRSSLSFGFLACPALCKETAIGYRNQKVHLYPHGSQCLKYGVDSEGFQSPHLPRWRSYQISQCPSSQTLSLLTSFSAWLSFASAVEVHYYVSNTIILDVSQNEERNRQTILKVVNILKEEKEIVYPYLLNGYVHIYVDVCSFVCFYYTSTWVEEEEVVVFFLLCVCVK